jgi:hypothetical protein
MIRVMRNRLQVLAPVVLLVLIAVTPASAQDVTVDDVRTLTAATTNDQRFDAVTALLKTRGVPFTVEEFSVPKPRGRDPRTRGRNIVVTLGEGPEDVVIGAHYDAVWLPDGTLSHGAVDNAASSTILAGVAAALRSERTATLRSERTATLRSERTATLGGERLAARIRIVWFDMEEVGLVGSQEYLAAHKGDRIRAMLNFDVNGYGDTVLYGQAPGADASVLAQALGHTCADQRLDCMRFNEMPNGDDRMFGKAGIPTISIGHLPAVEAHQLWLMMNARREVKTGTGAGSAAPAVLQIIHTPADTDDKLDGATLGRVQRFAIALARRVAG